MDDTNRKLERVIPLTATAHRSLHIGQCESRPAGAESDEAQGSSLAEAGAAGPSAPGSGLAGESRRAARLLKELGEEFVRLRSENRTSAWAAFQRKVALNLYVLVPVTMSLPEAARMLKDIEDFMKTDAGASIATPSEVLRGWLNSETVTSTGRPS